MIGDGGDITRGASSSAMAEESDTIYLSYATIILLQEIRIWKWIMNVVLKKNEYSLGSEKMER